MRWRDGLLIFSIGIFASACAPPDQPVGLKPNANFNAGANAANINADSAGNEIARADTGFNANVNLDTNAGANANSNLFADAGNANQTTNANSAPAADYSRPAANRNAPPAVPPAPPGTEIVGVPPLIVPVSGVRPEDLRNTFDESRSEGRSHDALDIMAPAGAPVVAVADGEIAKFHDSVRGGITTYQYSSDKKLIYYYAHLQSRAPNVNVGDFVRQGTVIGYVGDTGNSGAGNFHLHFAVWKIDDPKRFWEGTNINPYPLIRRGK